MNLNEKFRSENEIREIKKHHSPPVHYREILSIKEIEWLKSIQNSLTKTLMQDAYRNSFKSDDNHPLFQEVSGWGRERFYPLLGDFQVSAVFFYESPTPASATDSTIHTDVWDDERIIDKTILIPLEIAPDQEETRTIVFEQHYYHYGAAYAGKVGNKQTFGNTVILPKNYNKIERFREENFNKELYFKYLTHKPYSNFYGLSVEDTFKWRIGGSIIFDRTQLHCCDHYFKVNNRKWVAIWTNRGEINGSD